MLTSAFAAIVLASAATTAFATRFAFSENHFRVVWPAGERLVIESEPAGTRVKCPATLEGSFHSRTLSKVSGQLIGYITKAFVGNFNECVEANNVTNIIFLNENQGVNNSLPWHIQYRLFTGILPRIETIEIGIINFSYLITTTLGATCLYASTAAFPAFMAFLINIEGKITGLHANEAAKIPLHAGGAACPEPMRFKNNGTVTVQGATTSIFVRLVQ